MPAVVVFIYFLNQTGRRGYKTRERKILLTSTVELKRRVEAVHVGLVVLLVMKLHDFGRDMGL